ncbi:MAG: hypothetical protein ABR511_10955 [Acidimicrobiales bacterium]
MIAYVISGLIMGLLVIGLGISAGDLRLVLIGAALATFSSVWGYYVYIHRRRRGYRDL